MIYDEGFEMKIGDYTMLAFSKYYPDGGKKYKSDCGKTLVGWYHKKSTNERGCYMATKQGNDKNLINDQV